MLECGAIRAQIIPTSKYLNDQTYENSAYFKPIHFGECNRIEFLAKTNIDIIKICDESDIQTHNLRSSLETLKKTVGAYAFFYNIQMTLQPIDGTIANTKHNIVYSSTLNRVLFGSKRHHNYNRTISRRLAEFVRSRVTKAQRERDLEAATLYMLAPDVRTRFSKILILNSTSKRVHGDTQKKRAVTRAIDTICCIVCGVCCSMSMAAGLSRWCLHVMLLMRR